MTALFHDVHSDEKLNKFLEKDKIIGASFHEIRDADDTIIYSRSSSTLSKLLAKIQTEGERYGLKLNESKFETIISTHRARSNSKAETKLNKPAKQNTWDAY